MDNPATRTLGLVNVIITCVLMACIVMIIVGSALRWVHLARTPRPEPLPAE